LTTDSNAASSVMGMHMQPTADWACRCDTGPCICTHEECIALVLILPCCAVPCCAVLCAGPRPTPSRPPSPGRRGTHHASQHTSRHAQVPGGWSGAVMLPACCHLCTWQAPASYTGLWCYCPRASWVPCQLAPGQLGPPGC
jgi:hypothetical protein